MSRMSSVSPQLVSCLEEHTRDVLQWLLQSETVIALVVAPGGTILDRNPAGEVVFPARHPTHASDVIWDYLVAADADNLLRRFATSRRGDSHRVLLNVTAEYRSPVTLDVTVVASDAVFLLFATHEYRHSATAHEHILDLTNELSVTVRELSRKNKELEQAKQTMDRLARTDVLTGLANRRQLLEQLSAQIARAERGHQPPSVLIGDLDHFKSINDEYGHLAGDEVLTSAAAVARKLIRSCDVAARYGGEEFVVLFPETCLEDARRIAERIRCEIECIRVPACPRKITISVGLAAWRMGDTPSVFMGRADAALYAAKAGGRNRVETAVP